ncbi:MAG: bifunctional phosphoribosyl-AMP cyclohydrolase/phosphoribosyl-ATP diphosphatase HisIE [SAR202 cluster bacterium]|nr:bifunctional phosphoribosyl-AMP cyclohydrolase/phosphoribosyl-ATP diphosphatase HisIE [SAR202 cluster bacterium]
MTTAKPPDVKLDAQGLVAAICQDAATGEVLMVAHMNAEALRRTLETGQMHFYSRSRQELWHKGATSGSFLHVESAQIDCDGDVLLFKVRADGPACHTGARSCFFTPLDTEPTYARSEEGSAVLAELFQTIRQRQMERPQGSYTTKLFESGTARIAQKVGEEGIEVALAAVTRDVGRLPGEVADLFYHTMVLLADAGIPPDAVWAELRKRRK